MHPILESEAGLGGEEVRRRHVLPKALFVGVMAGLLASVFRLSLSSAEHLRQRLIAQAPGWIGVVAAVAICAAAAALSSWLVRRFAPHAAGSGIPHLKTVLMGDAEPEWRRLLPVKFFSGLVAIGGGLALGREGPTVQMGGAVGSMAARVLRVRIGEGERRALMSAGAGAGLAAAFNAPLAGLIFVLEELHGRFTPVTFVAAFLASVSADIVSRLLVSELQVFHVSSVHAPGVASLPFAAVLGGAAGVAGVFFNRALLLGLDLGDRARRSPGWMAAAAGALVGLAGGLAPVLSGSGGHLVQTAISGHIAVPLLLTYLGARFLMTMLSYATGAAGGIFAPLLVLGALGGLWFGTTVSPLVHASQPMAPQVYCILGMGALFTAIVRAPLTGIVLMIDLTGEYNLLLPLLVACLLAYSVAEWMGNAPIYEALRVRGSKT